MHLIITSHASNNLVLFEFTRKFLLASQYTFRKKCVLFSDNWNEIALKGCLHFTTTGTDHFRRMLPTHLFRRCVHHANTLMSSSLITKPQCAVYALRHRFHLKSHQNSPSCMSSLLQFMSTCKFLSIICPLVGYNAMFSPIYAKIFMASPKF